MPVLASCYCIELPCTSGRDRRPALRFAQRQARRAAKLPVRDPLGPEGPPVASPRSQLTARLRRRVSWAGVVELVYRAVRASAISVRSAAARVTNPMEGR